MFFWSNVSCTTRWFADELEYFVGGAIQDQECDVTVDGQRVMLNVEYQRWSYKFQTVYEPEQTYSIEFTMPITRAVSKESWCKAMGHYPNLAS